MGFLNRLQSRKRRSRKPSTTAPTPNSISTSVADHHEFPASTRSLRQSTSISKVNLCQQSQSSLLRASSSVADSRANTLNTDPTQPSLQSNTRQEHLPGVLQPSDFLGVPNRQLNAYVETLCMWKAENLGSSTSKESVSRKPTPAPKSRFGFFKARSTATESAGVSLPGVPAFELEVGWGGDGRSLIGDGDDEDMRQRRDARWDMNKRLIRDERDGNDRRKEIKKWTMNAEEAEGNEEDDDDDENTAERFDSRKVDGKGVNEKYADSFSLKSLDSVHTKSESGIQNLPCSESPTASLASDDNDSESVYSQPEFPSATSPPFADPNKSQCTEREKKYQPATLHARSYLDDFLADSLGPTIPILPNHEVLECGWRLLFCEPVFNTQRFIEFKAELGSRSVQIVYLGDGETADRDWDVNLVQIGGFVLGQEDGFRFSGGLLRALGWARWRCSKASPSVPSSHALLPSLDPFDTDSDPSPTTLSAPSEPMPPPQPPHDPQTCTCLTKIKRVLVYAVILCKTTSHAGEDILVRVPSHILPLRIETFGWRPQREVEVIKYAELARGAAESGR